MHRGCFTQAGVACSTKSQAFPEVYRLRELGLYGHRFNCQQLLPMASIFVLTMSGCTTRQFGSEFSSVVLIKTLPGTLNSH